MHVTSEHLAIVVAVVAVVMPLYISLRNSKRTLNERITRIEIQVATEQEREIPPRLFEQRVDRLEESLNKLYDRCEETHVLIRSLQPRQDL